MTHWEKRLFQNEAMTGTVHTRYPVYSRLTFALMEDTGWYMPDYSKVMSIIVEPLSTMFLDKDQLIWLAILISFTEFRI